MSNWSRGHRPSQSSVASLQYGLNPFLTLRLQATFLLSGLADSLQYKRTLEAIRSNPYIQASLTKCSLLQLFILVCVLLVDWLILPAWTRGQESGTGPRTSPETARFYFQLFWLYPLLGLSFLLSGSFFTNVAQRAGAGDVPSTSVSKGRHGGMAQVQHKSSLVSRALIIGVSLLISAVSSRIPLLGRPLSFIYLSIISSYYTFEYRFIASFNLHSLRDRVRYLEERWVYFLGFGMPSTILSSFIFSSQTLNLTIWSLTFPLFLLMAAHSDPLPFDSAKPAKSHDLPGQEISKGTTKFAQQNLNPEAHLPSWWPTRLPVLYLAVALDDLVSGFLGSFMRTSASGPKKSAEGFSSYGSTPSYNGLAYPSYGSGDAYAQRRDAYPRNNPLQSGFGIVTSAPQPNNTKGTGFARQADTYFGSLASGRPNGSAGPGQSPNSSLIDGGYGIGTSAGVAVRPQLPNGADGMQSRRRAAGAS